MPHRILVFRNGSIGNTIAAIPALKCLRNSFPEAQISVVVDPIGRVLLNQADYCSSLICYDRHNIDKGVAGFVRTARVLRRERPDTAILLKRFTRNGLLARLSGARRRFGFVSDGKAPFLTDAIQYDETVHVAELNLRLMKFLGASADVQVSPSIDVSAEATSAAKNWLQERGVKKGYIIAHFGGTTSGAHFVPMPVRIRLVSALADGKPILLIGNGASEEIEAIQLSKTVPNAVLATGEPLEKSIALIASASGFIGTNSGPMHIAAATGTPGVALFKQDERFEVERVKWRPLSTGLHIVPVPIDANADELISTALSKWQIR